MSEMENSENETKAACSLSKPIAGVAANQKQSKGGQKRRACA
jgi:hypothetical protein